MTYNWNASRLPELVLLAFLIVGGCTHDSTAASRVTRSDSAGIEIVWSAAPLWEESAGWKVDGDILWSTGGATSPVELLQVESAHVLDDTTIAVASTGLNEVLLLRAGGTSQQIGRSGDGPGEFSRLSGLYVCGQNRLVADDRNRIHIFNDSGVLQQSIRVTRMAGDATLQLRGLSTDCLSLAFSNRRFEVPQPGSTIRMPVTVFWTDTTGASRDTAVAAMPGWEVTSSNGADPSHLPWGAAAHVAVGADALVVGDSRTAELRYYDTSGQPGRVVRWQAPVAPVTEEDIARYEEMRRGFVRDFPPAGTIMLEVSDYKLPENKPVFHGILIDAVGNTWLRTYPDDVVGRPDLFGYGGPGHARIPEPAPETWTVFGVEGEWLGDVTMPLGFRLLNVYADRVVGVARDSLDVESVVVLPLEKDV